MEPADIEYLLQLLQSDLFRDMGTDVHEQLVHHQMFTAAPVSYTHLKRQL